jgi:Ribonuclease G/E
VAQLLFEEEQQSVQDLEREYNRKIIIKADPSLHLEQYDLVVL